MTPARSACETVRQRARQLLQRHAVRGARTRVDQIRDRLGAQQVEFAVQHRAFGELAGLRRSRAGAHERGEHGRRNVRAAVHAEFDDGFARVRMRRGKYRDQAVVERARRIVGVVNAAARRFARATGQPLARLRRRAGKCAARREPLTRTIAIAPRPGAVATAAMVSSRTRGARGAVVSRLAWPSPAHSK